MKTYICSFCKDRVKIVKTKKKVNIIFIEGKKCCENCFFKIKSANNNHHYFNKVKSRQEQGLYII